MSIKKKFAKVDAETKQQIMTEYLLGISTQRELGLKYNFHYRRLRHWFQNAGLLDDYNRVVYTNSVMAITAPCTSISKFKISGQNSLSWKGRKLDLKDGEISGVLIPMKDHPNANCQGYVYEHRLVVEKRLGI
jgi:hypothetical protein